MVKLVGSLCILAGSGLARWARLAERRRRRQTLSDILTALRRMDEEIRQARTMLPDLLEQAAADCGPDAAALFRTAAQAAAQGEDVSRAWRQAAGDLPLAEADKRCLAALELRGDEEQVRGAIALTASALARSGEEQDKRRQSEDQRATALCFSAAALLVILLI
ncbi:stage III sporulation protein AB [uncultured Dysosmobacter sp.]|uniref:stage III sporulation protein AB n=1 Tax=uncultured Dysosmobacter sp. TaxID=2591384 RepID=UPI00261A2183|nr:stage III sporulation protein AB [uncultured Dysosmobacter sp.]